MRNWKYTTTKRGGAARKLGDLQLTTCTYQHTIQMDCMIRTHTHAHTPRRHSPRYGIMFLLLRVICGERMLCVVKL